ncbi:hypothetical protein DO97_05335 [Neosynechococcus sphagnicola sy1]|uniref:Ycf66 family protein n=1 Tax=Neosynechococcus sphagnicola sy1 TaxID=1497020 RepID=A0A098TKF2_9CYAN|nr:Ycf66 family protein [Neosynechococcus sphagnicola]KGF72756.1 hypothetical protein DO97_05335 [Neosynechococcus sphagnicola sy1]
MVNIGFGWSSLLGVVLVVAGAALYFLRSVRPALARDHDIFFAAVGLLCGGILFFQGWRLDPILQFGQFLLTGSAIFFAVESIRMRGVATEQAKRDTPIVDEDRPVSRVYQAELDELNPYDERPVTRRIRGTRDTRSTYADEYEGEVRRRPPSRGSSSGTVDRPVTDAGDRSRRRRPRPETPASDQPITTAGREGYRESGTKPPRPSSSPSPRPSEPRNSGSDAPPRPKRPRPTQETVRQTPPSTIDPPADDYADYRPVNYPDEDDNSGNFD